MKYDDASSGDPTDGQEAEAREAAEEVRRDARTWATNGARAIVHSPTIWRRVLGRLLKQTWSGEEGERLALILIP